MASTPSMNKAAWLHSAGTALTVSPAPMPTPGPGELVIKNSAIAINPLDWHMQDHGVFIPQFPAIIGCDVAGVIHDVGPGAEGRFSKGDRVIGHAINLVSGRPQDGAFQLYTVVPAAKAAILPDSIPFTNGVVIPFALEAASCVLSVKELGTAMPGVSTPALNLPYPSLHPTQPLNKTLVIYGGSSSTGSMTTQLATAAGIDVVSIASTKNSELCKASGAVAVVDYHSPTFIDEVVSAVRSLGNDFIGIFDAIGTPETHPHDAELLEKLGGRYLACTHPPPPKDSLPEGVEAGMIFAVNDVANPVWEDYVTAALESGQLKCLPPPTIVGKGLEFVNEALKMSKEGVSATKLVVEL